MDEPAFDFLPASGELIGMSYLYNQSNQMLQDFPDDLVEPDGGEELEIEEEEEEDEEDIADEGVDELVFDSLVPLQLPHHVLSSQLIPESSSGDQEGAVSRSTISVDAERDPSTSVYQDMPPLEGEEEEPIAGPSWAFPAPSTSITAATAAVVTSTPLAATLPPNTTASTDAPTTSTMYNRKRMMARQAEAAKRGKTLKFRAPSIVHCGSCGKRKIKETGHRLLTKANGQRVNYCPVAAVGQRPEDWLAGLE
ncbi:uncharacterized protein LOC124857001 [Scomber scombrus]|uniref:Uncharacterized protein LOC124857001 n=1 Tax=Scomber scombrus TaxID=13677 RepID=A0AAV1Q6Z0_SCOSC